MKISLFTKTLMTVLLFLFVSTSGWAYDPNRIPRPLPAGTSDPLPEGWKFKDIGNITPPSDWAYVADQGLFYVKAYGKETFGSTDDECAFIYFETDEDKQVSVRIMDAEVVQNSAAKGFIMIRGGLEASDPWVYVEVKTQNNNRVAFCWRLEKGGANGSTGSSEEASGTNGSTFNPPNCYPRWIKFTRQGLYTTAYHKDDVEGAQWKKLGVVKKIELKGKAYMGIGVCSVLISPAYNGDNTKPAIYMFDNLEVSEIELPYEVLYDESVEKSFLEPLKPGRYKDINITKVFGHALGEYFTIDCESTDPTIADAYFWEQKVTNPGDGEEFIKYVRVTGKKEGVTSIKLNCTINGYSMQTDYALNVSDGKAKPKTAITTAPYGWELKNLSIPVNPDVVWGEEFVTKKLSLQKQFPVFLGAWEYDWSVLNKDGVADGGNYGTTNPEDGKTGINDGPISNTAHPAYIAKAGLYNFRDLSRNYPTSEGFPGYTNRKEITGGSSIDLSYIIANDTAKEIVKSDFISIDKGSDGTYFWESSTGFWTELHNIYDPETRTKVRGYPYLSNVSVGDWIQYTVYAPRSGYYSIYPMAAIKDISNKPSLQIDINGVTQVKEMYLAKSNNSSDWQKGVSSNALFNEGKNIIRVRFNNSGINFLGLRIAFSTASKEPYAGINFDTLKYARVESMVDTLLMTNEEKIIYSECLDGTIFNRYPKWDADSVNAYIAQLPTSEMFDEEKIISMYYDQLGDLQNASTEEQLKYIQTKLTNSFDTLSFVTTQQQQFNHIDVTSYMFKKGFDPKKKIEISMKIDTIVNAGKGTYMGIMLRSLYYDGNKSDVASNSDFASFGIGSYEGGRLSYRWNYGYDYKKFDNESIAQNVYIKIRLNEFAPGYMTAYYSYDNLYWWDYSKDPLKVDFLNAHDLEEIAAGIFITGGNFANDATLAQSKLRDLNIVELADDEDFSDIDSAEDMVNTALTMSSTTVRPGESVDIQFNITKPGLVSLNVYNAYGLLVESILDMQYMDFNKEGVTINHTFKNLKETGIYMLRLEAPNNEQYIRFRFNQ